ncbi:hypothetical protein [Streptomyces sp. NPDC004230]
MRYIAKITAVHEDGTQCTHTGHRDPRCPGRRGYRATCTGGGCTWSTTGKRSGALADDSTNHLRSHLTASTRPRGA